MKWLGRILLCCAVLAVLLLGGRTLVAGPETEQSPMPETAAATETVIACVGTETAVPELPEREQESIQRERAEMAEGTYLQLPAPQTDRNGQPITSRAWYRTVYSSCTPNGIRGRPLARKCL